METSAPQYQAYLSILQQELVPATGCTEPIAIAWLAAKAREVLGEMPTHLFIQLSGPIIKNAKSATVPGTGGGRGIPIALAAGFCVGRAEKMLEVIAQVPPEKIPDIQRFSVEIPIEMGVLDNGHLFEIVLTATAGETVAKLHVVDAHTNLVWAEKNGETLFSAPREDGPKASGPPYHLLNVADIVAFAQVARPEDIAPLLGPVFQRNTAIAQEGFRNHYGASIGNTILAGIPEPDSRTLAKATAAAASDARMGGCPLPVIITAGSGNQGLTSSLPVIVYAQKMGASEEELHRALALSALLTIHQKNAIGKLSAFCGAVSAGVGAGAGIAFLHRGRYLEISHTIVNALAILSGMVCDGAKPSCAAKIAMAVDAGILGYEMYRQGQEFYRGDGLVAADVEATIANIGHLGKEGMEGTGREILRMMTL